MEMHATGVSKGEWIFFEDFDRTTTYLADVKKILSFNPFCHSVELTDTENVYKWNFRVTDPQNNPFDIIFLVEQSDELQVELPDHIECSDPDELTDEMIKRYTVCKKVRWKHHNANHKISDPKNYLFEGKVSGEMDIHRAGEHKSKVHFDLRVDVRFLLYPAFRIVPKRIVRTMVNGGMSLIMQTATNSMFHSMSKDFCKIQKI
ncbi:MAG: hypothetical protein HKK67_02750 [Chlorobiaceae bacterium]|nr:hypothetical protein [Chlorobiaceae bacterium]